MAKIILETTRLVLRQLAQEDYPDLAEILQDETVMYAYEHPFSNEEVQQWLANQLRRYRQDGLGLWAMMEKQSGAMVGQCGLTWQPCNGRQLLEIGYLLKRKYWGQGYATEAAVACKEYAFEALLADEVYSIIRANNWPSQRVAERNGMQVAGHTVKHYYGMEMPHDIYCVAKEAEKFAVR